MSRSEWIAFILGALLFWYIVLYQSSVAQENRFQASVMNWCMWLLDQSEREMCIGDAEMERRAKNWVLFFK